MTEPNLELQRAIRNRLVASSAVVSLVPATSIVDRNSLPVDLPSIILGEGQTMSGGDIARNRHDVFLDLHVWFKEPGLERSKQATGAIRAALMDSYWSAEGLHVADLYVTSSRFLRDPDGEHSHAVIGLSAVVTGVPA